MAVPQLIAGANGIEIRSTRVSSTPTGSATSCSTGCLPIALARHVEDRFRGRVGRTYTRILDAVATGARPHHGFHVFAVYPWAGLLRGGIVDQPLHVLDQCRTTPALVTALEGDTLLVRAPLRSSGTVDDCSSASGRNAECVGVTTVCRCLSPRSPANGLLFTGTSSADRLDQWRARRLQAWTTSSFARSTVLASLPPRSSDREAPISPGDDRRGRRVAGAR